MSEFPSWATPGRKVACVDADWSSDPPVHPLVKDATYTIESTYMWVPVFGPTPMLRLKEIDHPFIPGFGFTLDRFRPLVEDSDEDGIEARLYRNKGLRSKQPERADA